MFLRYDITYMYTKRNNPSVNIEPNENVHIDQSGAVVVRRYMRFLQYCNKANII